MSGAPAVKRYGKALASAVGVLAGALAAGLLDGRAEVIGYAIVSVATVLGVYQAPYRPAGHVHNDNQQGAPRV